MTRLWTQSQGTWEAVEIPRGVVGLAGRAGDAIVAPGAPCDAQILPAQCGVELHWTLLAARGVTVRINGSPIPAGITAVSHLDTIQIGAATMIFADSRQAGIENYPGDRPIKCPRCTEKIHPETPSVQCPRCARWLHESVERPCWTHGATCPCCDHQSTLLDQEPWRPEGEIHE